MTATLHAAPETITVPDAPEAPAAADPTTDTTPAAPEVGPVGVIIELAAHQVAQHPDNVRDASRGITELTASIRDVGIIVPLIVVPVEKAPGHEFPEGVTHVAVDGNRRQAAAAAAGVPLRCEVRADLASAKATARTMAVTGLLRDGLTAREEAHAVSVLFDAKMSGAAIGRALGRSTAAVKTARRAAALSAEVAQATDYPLTLDQMAILADYQDDPEATAVLLRAAPQGQMEHIAAQLEAEANAATVIDAALAPLITTYAAAGVTVLDAEPDPYASGGPRLLSALTPGEDPDDERYDAKTHARCPGHAVWLDSEYYPAEEDTPEEVGVQRSRVVHRPGRERPYLPLLARPRRAARLPPSRCRRAGRAVRRGEGSRRPGEGRRRAGGAPYVDPPQQRSPGQPGSTS